MPFARPRGCPRPTTPHARAGAPRGVAGGVRASAITGQDEAAATPGAIAGAAQRPSIKRRSVARSYGPGTAEQPTGTRSAASGTPSETFDASPAAEMPVDPSSSGAQTPAPGADDPDRYGRHADSDQSISAKDLIARLREERR